MRGRVEPLDVEQEVVGTVLRPELQADGGVRLRGRVGPLEVREVVGEVELPRRLLGADGHEPGELLRRDVLRPLEGRGDAGLEPGRGDLAGAARSVRGVLHQEVVGEVVRDDRAADGLRRPGRPPSDDVDGALAGGEDVPESLGAAHLARDGELLAGRRVDGDEVADAVAVGRLPGRDRRPDHGGQERLSGQERRVRSLAPELCEVGELSLGHQEVDRLGIRAVETEHEDAAGLLAAAREEGGERGGDAEGERQERGARAREHGAILRPRCARVRIRRSHGHRQVPVPQGREGDRGDRPRGRPVRHDHADRLDGHRAVRGRARRARRPALRAPGRRLRARPDVRRRRRRSPPGSSCPRSTRRSRGWWTRASSSWTCRAPGVDAELERRLGAERFAAIAVGDDEYILSFTVDPDAPEDDLLASLGILRLAVDQKLRQDRYVTALQEARRIQMSILPKRALRRGSIEVSGFTTPGRARRRRLLRLHPGVGPASSASRSRTPRATGCRRRCRCATSTRACAWPSSATSRSSGPSSG